MAVGGPTGKNLWSQLTRINVKLAAKYYGPYPVVERIGAVAYKVKLPEGSRVHPVFHTSLLKKAVGTYNEEEHLPDHLEGDKGSVCEPVNVLARRTVLVQGEEVCQVLIQWKGQPAEAATWEDTVLMKSQFPKFCPEDKAVISGGSIVRTGTDSNEPRDSLIHQEAVGPRVWKVYSRRGKRVKEG
ncbi:hypothetical protein A2U01_0007790 [Trifolium medium]|uniref:Tf2-1-like SH3-like domain-containing protein n=1 Tax=Trifolium medium TaxID=97028 RepID=A0A392MHG3_9FABA|nr:hypothetical protein [Trifolium medium]